MPSINRIINANLYSNGASLLGKADEVTLPQIKTKPTDHTPLGLMGSLEYAAGIDKMTMNIKWNSFYPDVAKTFANPYKAVEMQIRANVESYEGSTRTGEKPLVCYVRGSCNDFPLGNYKSATNATFESNLAITYCKLEFDGATIIEIDVEANIYMVDGVDLMANYRKNLGI